MYMEATHTFAALALCYLFWGATGKYFPGRAATVGFLSILGDPTAKV